MVLCPRKSTYDKSGKECHLKTCTNSYNCNNPIYIYIVIPWITAQLLSLFNYTLPKTIFCCDIFIFCHNLLYGLLQQNVLVKLTRVEINHPPPPQLFSSSIFDVFLQVFSDGLNMLWTLAVCV